jgi:gamma-glutamyltranspeptidase / glutathione hydrolase
LLGIWDARVQPGSTTAPPPRLIDQHGMLDPHGVHYLAEAGRLVFADRDTWIADPGFVPLPGGPRTFIDPRYLAERARQIGERAMAGQAQAGTPGTAAGALPVIADDTEQPATTHLSIIDARGNAVSLTSSIEGAFGARLMVGGFLLNHQMTDFSFEPAKNGKLLANRVEPGKRPRSSMAPTIVLDRHTGRVRAVIGSPGGPRIIPHVAHTLIAMLDDGLAPQKAVSLPQFANRNGDTEIERSVMPDTLADALVARGHRLRRVDTPSGLHAILVDCGSDTARASDCELVAGVDPRREGEAIVERASRRP